MQRVILLNLSGLETQVCHKIFGQQSGENLAQHSDIAHVLKALESQVTNHLKKGKTAGKKSGQTRFSVKGLSKIRLAKRAKAQKEAGFEYLSVPPVLLPFFGDLARVFKITSVVVLLGDPEDWIAVDQGDLPARTPELWLSIAQQLLHRPPSDSDLSLILPAQEFVADPQKLSSLLPDGSALTGEPLQNLGRASLQHLVGALKVLDDLRDAEDIQEAYSRLRKRLAIPDGYQDGTIKERFLHKMDRLSLGSGDHPIQERLEQGQQGQTQELQSENQLLQLIIAQMQEEMAEMAEQGQATHPIAARSGLNPKIVRMARLAR